jgi:hypothetical protein
MFPFSSFSLLLFPRLLGEVIIVDAFSALESKRVRLSKGLALGLTCLTGHKRREQGRSLRLAFSAPGAPLPTRLRPLR